LTIQHDAVVECISEHAARVQRGFSPCVCRARNDVASKSASRYRPVNLVIIQQSLADNQKIVIALCSICPARAASKQDDGARMQPLHEAVYRLLKSCILY